MRNSMLVSAQCTQNFDRFDQGNSAAPLSSTEVIMIIKCQVSVSTANFILVGTFSLHEHDV